VSYTIRSARFANAERTAIVAETDEAGAVVLNPGDASLSRWGKQPDAYVAPQQAPARPSDDTAKVVEALIAEGVVPAAKAAKVRERLGLSEPPAVAPGQSPR
jgi:hypothetical protein